MRGKAVRAVIAGDFKGGIPGMSRHRSDVIPGPHPTRCGADDLPVESNPARCASEGYAGRRCRFAARPPPGGAARPVHTARLRPVGPVAGPTEPARGVYLCGGVELVA